MAADFRWRVCRFRFRAVDAISFPPHAGNVLRGALGFLLDEKAFRPAPSAGVPSGFRNAPRPFVIRCRELDGRHLSPGSSWCFELNLFDPDLDPGRAVKRLKALRGAAVQWQETSSSAHYVDLAEVQPASRMRVEFLTPTELKGHDDNASPPPFAVLLKRARDRVSALAAFYGGAAPETDFRGLGERAGPVRLISGRVLPLVLARTSSRTGETHPLGGFTGYAEYAGGLGEFVPWLKAAEATGVGRHTVWGNGAIAVRLDDASHATSMPH